MSPYERDRYDPRPRYGDDYGIPRLFHSPIHGSRLVGVQTPTLGPMAIGPPVVVNIHLNMGTEEHLQTLTHSTTKLL